MSLSLQEDLEVEQSLLDVKGLFTDNDVKKRGSYRVCKPKTAIIPRIELPGKTRRH